MYELIDNNVINKLNEIERNYDLICFKEVKPNTSKSYLGDKDHKVCRFCGRDSDNVSFKKKAHAIPELLGNKTLFSYYECDECNQKFSQTLENNLSAYLSYYRALVGISGKRGKIKFKQHDINMHTQDNMFYIESIGENGKINIDENNHMLSIKINRDPYIPIAVYKCFVKIALTLLDEKDLDEVNWALQWVSEENHNQSNFNIKPLYLYSVFTPGYSPYENITVQIFRRKKQFGYKVPYKYKREYMLCVLRFENFIFQVNIPSIYDFNQGKITIKPFIYPGLGKNYPFGESDYQCVNMSCKEFINQELFTINLSFEHIEDVTDKMRLKYEENNKDDKSE